MYRRLVGSSGCFHAPETNSDAPGGNRAPKPRFICDARYLYICTNTPSSRWMDSGSSRSVYGKEHTKFPWTTSKGFTTCLYTQIHGRISGCWKGVWYVWTVLCFRWCEPLYIYHMLSSTVAQYLRHLDVPITTRLGDFWMSNFRATKLLSTVQQREAAREVASLALTVFYQCGYFMSIGKCVLEPTTRLVLLGIICDSEVRRFKVPEDKLPKLEVILTAAITSGWISFVDLERLTGKCTSMSVAVPPASLYTHHMYKHIEKFRCTGGRLKAAMIAVQRGRGLWD